MTTQCWQHKIGSSEHIDTSHVGIALQGCSEMLFLTHGRGEAEEGAEEEAEEGAEEAEEGAEEEAEEGGGKTAKYISALIRSLPLSPIQ